MKAKEFCEGNLQREMVAYREREERCMKSVKS